MRKRGALVVIWAHYIHSDQLLLLKNQLYADHWGESKTPVDATSFYLVESEPPPLSPSQSPFMNPSKFCIIKFLRAGTSIEFYIGHTPPNSPKIFYSTFLNIQVWLSITLHFGTSTECSAIYTPKLLLAPCTPVLNRKLNPLTRKAQTIPWNPLDNSKYQLHWQ